MFSSRRISAALVGLLVLVAGGWLVQDVIADGDSGPAVVALSDLPPQVAETWRRIEAGGAAGSVFGNRERLLPQQPPGYYREYPVRGGEHRGARRLVVGEDDELYYTGDNYQSFILVDPDR